MKINDLHCLELNEIVYWHPGDSSEIMLGKVVAKTTKFMTIHWFFDPDYDNPGAAGTYDLRAPCHWIDDSDKISEKESLLIMLKY
jgi:hypothetical protein